VVDQRKLVVLTNQQQPSKPLIAIRRVKTPRALKDTADERSGPLTMRDYSINLISPGAAVYIQTF